MSYENMNIEIKGLSSQSSIEALAREVAEKIHWQAPSDSCLKLVCEQTKQAIKSSCRIASQTGIFVAEVVSDCPVKGLKKLESKIQRQLDSWKSKRFSEIFNSNLESVN